MTITGIHSIPEWKAWLDNPTSKLYEKLTVIYGGHDHLEAPKALLRQCLEKFAHAYGEDRQVFIVRSTGRINLLGMHVDHRGGSVNPIAIKEAFFVVEPRHDDKVVLRDINGAKFPEESFGISACLPKDRKIDDWDFWCHSELEKRKGDPSITFSNYARSAVLYFQHLYTDEDGNFNPAFKGMNVMIGSNIPPAAGLSSSSCLVVASAEAILHINNVRIDPMQFCEHCGIAEWYVGTRGGFGDHAAIKMGRCNNILHITAFPFSIQVLPFPDDYCVVLADSQVAARKQTKAKDGFNTPLASYAFGLWLVLKNFPQYSDKIKHLRDINPETLGVSEANILRIIKSLPQSATREEILARLPEKENDIMSIFRSHSNPGLAGYKIRQVCLYGISECIRSNMSADLLKLSAIDSFGRLISLHHDGDRVTRLRNGQMLPEEKDYSDAKMDTLIADSESGDPARVERSHIWAQPGAYNVSVPQIDMLVDLALQTDGVAGAGLVGAGLGGSMIALVKTKDAQKLLDNLANGYYRPSGLPVRAEIVKAVAGAGIL